MREEYGSGFTLEDAQANPDQVHAPYAEALMRHADKEPIQLMVPGHSGRNGDLSERLNKVFGPTMTRLDIPLMLNGIDLGEDSPLAQAQLLAAEAWGARRTGFMTNGASQANRTAAIAARGLGARVPIQRNSHPS